MCTLKVRYYTDACDIPTTAARPGPGWGERMEINKGKKGKRRFVS